MRIVTFAYTAAALAAAGFAGSATAQSVRGVTKTEIIIGMNTDLSGPAASYGVTSSNAARLGFDAVNAYIDTLIANPQKVATRRASELALGAINALLPETLGGDRKSTRLNSSH